MVHKIANIKNISQLKFDDIIVGEFLGGKYTHHVDNEAMFLMQEKVNNKWEILNFYCVGFRSFKDTVNKFDLKKLRT